MRRLCFQTSKVFLVLTIIHSLSFSAVCPSYVKKDGKIGSLSALTNGRSGWYVYGKPKKKGIYKSPLSSYNPKMIPNTNTDIPISIDISDDGKWIVYLDVSGGSKNHNLYLMRSDGSHKIKIPYKLYKKNQSPNHTGFYRSSPFGNEIFYYDRGGYGGGNFGTPHMRAVKITLPGSGKPSAGTDRLLADVSPSHFYSYGGSITSAVWKDQIFCHLYASAPGGRVTRNGFITIPNGGKGTAKSGDLFPWINEGKIERYGCGQTMSHDGQLCLANGANIGNECIPGKYAKVSGNMMDHKGFYITKFFRKSDPSITYDDQVTKKALSVNWCPKKFQYGNYEEVSFSSWSFSNYNDFVIGSLSGSKAKIWGLWVVEWKTNTWTLITPERKSSILEDPVLFFTVNTPVIETKNFFKQHNRMKQGIVQPMICLNNNEVNLNAGIYGFVVYSVTGQRIWSYYRNNADRNRSIQIPDNISNANHYLIQYVN